jgi:hypothetical protein
MKKTLIYTFLILVFTPFYFGQKKLTDYNLFQDEKSKKWGFKDEDDKVVIKAKYDKIYEAEHNVSIVVVNKKFGLIDDYGKEILPTIYEEMYLFSRPVENHFVLVKKNGKWGFLDEKGKETIPIKYEIDQVDIESNFMLDYFSYLDKNHPIIFADNKKFGVINLNYDTILPFEYDNIIPYRSYNDIEKYIVNKSGKWSVLDEKLNVLKKFDYEDFVCVFEHYILFKGDTYTKFIDVDNFEEFDSYPKYENSIFSCYKNGLNGKWGVINAKGETLIDFKFDYPIEGNIYSILDKKRSKIGEEYFLYGIVDEKGNIKEKAKYLGIYQTKSNLKFTLYLNDKSGIMNKDYQLVLPIIYNEINIGKNCETKVELDEKIGLIDSLGNFILPLIYEDIIFDGYVSYILKKDDKYGIIDKNKKEILPLIYDEIDDSGYGLFYVKQNGKVGYANKKGEFVIPMKFDEEIKYFMNGIAAVKLNGKIGFIDTLGSTVIEFKYDKIIYDFNDNFCGLVLDGKIGFVDSKGNILIDFIYDEVEIPKNNYTFNKSETVKLKRNDKWVEVNKKTGKEE